MVMNYIIHSIIQLICYNMYSTLSGTPICMFNILLHRSAKNKDCRAVSITHILNGGYTKIVLAV